MPPKQGSETGERASEGFEALFKRAAETPDADIGESEPSQSVSRSSDPVAPKDVLPKDAETSPAPKRALKPKPHFHDHRKRLRNKFERRGAEAFEDYELLELILFQALPRIDTKPIAKALIDQFGSLAEVVAAPIGKLTKVKGIGPGAAQHLKILQQVSIRVGQSSIINRPILSSWNALLDYCRAAMQFEGREQFRVLFLDRKNRLLADEVLGQGTVDRAPVYPREIVRRALVHEATAIILVHNHPSGDPTPSRQDIVLTEAIVETAKAIDVIVHDHLVVGREDVASFKILGLL